MSNVIAFKSDIRNKRKFRKLKDLPQMYQRAVRFSWFELAKDLKDEVNNEILRGRKSGRIYIVRTRAGNRRRHRASAPGETHANLTGKLRRSLSWLVQGHEQLQFGYGVSTTAKNAAPVYAGAIEFGRVDGSIAPRPSIENGIKATERKVEDHFTRALLREFRRS